MRERLRTYGALLERPAATKPAFQLTTEGSAWAVQFALENADPDWEAINLEAERRSRGIVTEGFHGVVGEVFTEYAIQDAINNGFLDGTIVKPAKPWYEHISGAIELVSDAAGRMLVHGGDGAETPTEVDLLYVPRKVPGTRTHTPVVVETKLTNGYDHNGTGKLRSAVSNERILKIFNPLSTLLKTETFGYVLAVPNDTPLPPNMLDSVTAARLPVSLVDFKLNAVKAKFNSRRNR